MNSVPATDHKLCLTLLAPMIVDDPGDLHPEGAEKTCTLCCTVLWQVPALSVLQEADLRSDVWAVFIRMKDKKES